MNTEDAIEELMEAAEAELRYACSVLWFIEHRPNKGRKPDKFTRDTLSILRDARHTAEVLQRSAEALAKSLLAYPRRDGPELKFQRGRRPPEREHTGGRACAGSYLLSAAVLGEGLLSGALAAELGSAAPFECPLPFAELSNEELSAESLLGDPFWA
jgi:hypothetical protein